MHITDTMEGLQSMAPELGVSVNAAPLVPAILAGVGSRRSHSPPASRSRWTARQLGGGGQLDDMLAAQPAWPDGIES
jgi:hypothetical protein